MRLTAILVLLALPALAQAQQVAVGRVIPTPSSDVPDFVQDAYVNAEECDAANARTVELIWAVALETGETFGRGGVFRIYATNVAPAVTNGVSYCEEADKTDVWAEKIGPDITSGTGTIRNQATVDTAALAEAANFSCTMDARTIHVCVHYYPYTGTSGSDPGERKGSAFGTFQLSTVAPSAPVLDRVDPGNERLLARWTPASTGATATWFQIEATESGASTPAAIDLAQGREGFVDPLTNGVEYEVTVRALSVAGNASEASNAVLETPVPSDDFWDRYQAAGGQEQGGCATGAAGPLALLGLAVALSRRRAGRRP